MTPSARSRHRLSPPAGRTLFGRLAGDTRGNTLMIIGASMIPLIGMIGSGIDMSRGYMAQTRLQQACDAAALAGRRAMTNGTVDAAVQAEALKFFRFNFPTGTQGVAGTAGFKATGFTPVVGSAPNTTVTVTASTTVPTTLMKMFGFHTLPIEADCNARLDFVNTDVVLVLDTTGSMLVKADPSDADTKIVALRKAVLSFYDQLEPIKTQLEAAGLRMRFSVVPYASSINLGHVLRGVSNTYVASDTWTYQSREFSGTYQHVEFFKSQTYCAGKGGTHRPDLLNRCVYSDTNPTDGTPNWNYLPKTWNISGYVASTSASPVDTPTRAPGSSTTSWWAGCIEERQTVNTMTATSTSIPTGAKDLDIDLIPTSDASTKWKPYWPEVSFSRTGSFSRGGELRKPQVACPAQAKRLQAWDRAALSTYLDTLHADGGTYHDNGMIWGIRMLSGTGVFGSDNPSTYGGMPVSKYIIFMTDGLFDTGYEQLYTTYGLEKWDARVTAGGGSDDAVSEAAQQLRHIRRFDLLCSLAKTRGISIWVVAFDQALDSSLQNCASNAEQASVSADQDELEERFAEIGRNIGALRLTQ